MTRTRALGAAGLLAVLAATSGCSVRDTPTPGATQHPASARTATASHAAAPASTPTGCNPAAALSGWSAARRAAQLVVAPAQEDDVLAARPMVEAGVGGLLLFGSAAPASLPTQLAALHRHALGGLPPLVMTDEEGGEIQRMANLVGNLPWPRTMAATMTTGQVR
ncbi:MAG TPA: hypothetical protein VG123_19470, partial [Streptosporangiaceae bacterium]|nr:hypothetical protein [Streptosporangiaceae bacterium]